MAFQIRYRPLCVVTIRHGFHLNKGSVEFDDLHDNDEEQRKEKQQKLSDFNIFDDLRLDVPDDTRHTLSALGLLLKPTPSGFIIGSAAEELESAPGVFVPRVIPRHGYRLRFVLRARAPYFWDYTNLEFGRPRGHNLELGPRGQTIYYLSNRTGALVGNFPSLSAPPPVYASGTVYHAGDVVRPSPESVKRFLALRTGAHPAPPAEAIEDPNWRRICPSDDAPDPDKPRNYVGTADRATLYPPTFPLPFRPDTVTMASAELVGPNETVHEVGSAAAPSGETLDKLMINARAVPPGQFLLKVNGRDKSGNDFKELDNIYIDEKLQPSRVFSIIELFHEPAKPNEPNEPDAPLGDFRLYERAGDGFTLRDWEREPEGAREFRVYLLNRHTFWRYHFPSPRSGTEFGDLEPVNGDDGRLLFVTKRAMPLTRGVARVEFAGDALLPNPPGGPVVPEPDRVYSDIYVHTK